jgi:hypothetical protein
MSKAERITSVRFYNHGHYKVTISYYGKEYTAVVTDMMMIDEYLWKRTKRAADELYNYVKLKAL